MDAIDRSSRFRYASRARRPDLTIYFRTSMAARRARAGLAMALPAVIFFAVFYIYTLMQTFSISTMRWGLLDTPQPVGAQNYLTLFRDAAFLNSVRVTFLYVFGTVVPIWFVALAFALVFNRNFRLRGAYLAVVYLPAVISLTVWSMIWTLMYHPSFGVVGALFRVLGFEYQRFLQDPDLALPSLVVLSVWKGTPVYMVILLSGLRGIPTDYYEAATVDGANALQQFVRITLPLLRPVMLYVMVVSIIEGFKVFTPMYIMTRGGPGSATRVLPMFIFENGFQFLKMGYASAASVVFFAILLVLSYVQFRTMRSNT